MVVVAVQENWPVNREVVPNPPIEVWAQDHIDDLAVFYSLVEGEPDVAWINLKVIPQGQPRPPRS